MTIDDNDEDRSVLPTNWKSCGERRNHKASKVEAAYVHHDYSYVQHMLLQVLLHLYARPVVAALFVEGDVAVLTVEDDLVAGLLAS